ncbi:MAG: extracellular solute-binding protein [Limnohabitans sp.]|nr:extracellular solute-binding protein [Limnohabitans sp.]
MRRRRCLGLLTAELTGLGLVASACRAPARERKTLRFWALGREGEVAHELLTDFRHENPECQLKIEQFPWSVGHEKILTAVAGDSVPDVAQLGNSWLAEMVALRALTPLDEPLARSPIRAEQYFEGLWATHVLSETLYGLPWTVDTRLLYYRRDWLQRLGYESMPTRWDDFLAVLRKIKTSGLAEHPIYLPPNEYEPLLVLALQYASELVTQEGRAQFSGQDFQQALGRYLALFHTGLASTKVHSQLINLWQDFAQGRYACFVSGPWGMGELRRRLPPAQMGIWATAPMPGPSGVGDSMVGGSSLVIFRQCRHPELAWKLMAYLSRPAVQKRFFHLTGNLPPGPQVWKQTGLHEDSAARAFLTQLYHVKATPAVPQWERVANEMQIMAARQIEEAPSASQLEKRLRDFDTHIDAILEKYRAVRAMGAPA